MEVLLPGLRTSHYYMSEVVTNLTSLSSNPSNSKKNIYVKFIADVGFHISRIERLRGISKTCQRF